MRKYLILFGCWPNLLSVSERLEWSTVESQADIALVLSRIDVPRKERTIVLLPSAAIRIGALSNRRSRHSQACIARKVTVAEALKLFQERTTDFGQEQFHRADAGTRNLQSQGVRHKSLGGIQACRLGDTCFMLSSDSL